jgi:hypothetical protein
VLLMALFLSTFSIPNDIKNRTIYTVVTKPIRAGEIVLGRTLGFVAVGTVMLVAMGLISYVFVRGGLSHEHVMQVADLTEDPVTKLRTGQTSFEKHHRHTVTVDAEGKGRTNVVHGHWHDVEIVGDQVRIGPPKGDLIARAPVYGDLVILGRDGKVVEKGINVGNEWDYRGFIEGGPPGGISKAAAIWTFEGVTPEKYPKGLPLEMTIRVFRSYKGDIEQGVLGEIVLRNPDPAAAVKRSGPILFSSKEYVADYHLIERELNSESGSGRGKIDLFNDLVSSDGRLEVEIRCVEPAQYFGVAQADVYLRPADSTFEQFVRDVANGVAEGGGPIESTIRILTQQNVMTELDGMGEVVAKIIEGMDAVLMRILQAATYALPDFTRFDTVMFVADGYSIFPALVAQQVTMALVYFLVVTIVGYFCLKSREIAA